MKWMSMILRIMTTIVIINKSNSKNHRIDKSINQTIMLSVISSKLRQKGMHLF